MNSLKTLVLAMLANVGEGEMPFIIDAISRHGPVLLIQPLAAPRVEIINFSIYSTRKFIIFFASLAIRFYIFYEL